MSHFNVKKFDFKTLGAKKEQQLQEDLMHRRFRAKFRFRGIARLVIANLHWMIEDEAEYEGDDVKRRVARALVRSKAKSTPKLLSTQDKVLLSKPAQDRTDQEKKYINRIIGGLKCFKRYPDHVKRKLAAATYFKYYGPNRVVVRQHQEAHALYFIVSGEVIVSQRIFDEVVQKDISIDVGVMPVGTMFGEVSLLHNIPRTATCTTSGHCEFLALMKDDFKTILQATVQQQWDDIYSAMNAFCYFDTFDEVARREGCIVSFLKNYKEGETILADGCGMPNYVHFVLSGECQMIESIQIITKICSGKKRYNLYDPFVMPDEISIDDIDLKYFKTRQKSSSLPPTKESSKCQTKCSIKSRRSSSNITKSSALTLTRTKSSADSISVTSQEPTKIILPEQDGVGSQSYRYSLIPEVMTMPQFSTHFMQVCLFTPGASFGFGENMRDRRIVALTKVDCMLMPKVWLMQKNPANIWSRIEHYLKRKIPTKHDLFCEFVRQRRWLEYKDKVVSEIMNKTKKVNSTTSHDVPYSIRIAENIDH